MVYRIYTERRPEYSTETKILLEELNTFLGIENISSIRILNRYDVEKIEGEKFNSYIETVFSDPQLDLTYESIPEGADYIFAMSLLQSQFDQRANSAAKAIQFLMHEKKPIVKYAKIYLIYGDLSESDKINIEKYLINPVESEKVSLELYESLEEKHNTPDDVEIIDGFIGMEESELLNLLDEYSLAMDLDDVILCQEYFISVKRDPTYTELRMIDTYWSDHCRHTTFLTTIDNVEIEDSVIMSEYENYIKIRSELGRTKPVNLMDIATIGARYLKSKGMLDRLDESEEVNACTVNIDVEIDGKSEEWLLFFKNETHNHPTEIEPFGGAATCLGGAIRDALSGRSYVYQAMRVTGAANPHIPYTDTLSGKLPQRKITTTAAEGYSSYGNQIGIAAGLVDEIYHSGYIAKRMEIGALVGAAPKENVIRMNPEAGDVVLLIGGRTGRDGCGGATGSSKSHTEDSLKESGAEVQKGNALEERHIQRLFRNPDAAKLIKRCNDFGAGGVAVAIGELADGLFINLDTVPTKYDGLDGTELAISESQERMAVVIAPEDVESFIAFADFENVEATTVAQVTEEPYLRMSWRGKIIVDISREFLNSNGAEKRTEVVVGIQEEYQDTKHLSFTEGLIKTISDLNACSKQGLAERFDATAGGNTVLMPFGGKYQATPIQSMVAKVPVLGNETDTCSIMSYGYNPFITEKNQFLGSYLAVVESISKIVATGGYTNEIYLSFQEYFERLGKSPSRWGKPFAALLGALRAQLDLGAAAIGGKDSMSGTFDELDVPPTLVSFAVGVSKASKIISPEFKKAGNKVVFVEPLKNGILYNKESLIEIYSRITKLIEEGKIISAYVPTFGGIAAAVFKMCIGNRIGFSFDENVDFDDLFSPKAAGFVLELMEDIDFGTVIGTTTKEYNISFNDEIIPLTKAKQVYDDVLEDIFPTKMESFAEEIEKISVQTFNRHTYTGKRQSKPSVLIPVFPGTSSEYEIAYAFEKFGAKAETFIVKNKNPNHITESVQNFAKAIKEAQIIFIPGGMSGGGEPDGAAKLINAFFRNDVVREQVEVLLNNREGLIGGFGDGFNALIRLGLLPYGQIMDKTIDIAALSTNTLGRYVSKLVHTRISSIKSPWLAEYMVGDIHTMPFSSAYGRFVCSDEMLNALIAGGQIATQYVDSDGNPSMALDINPSGSFMAIEGITSPDGRVFGKMGYSELFGENLYKNFNILNDNYHIFKAAIDYFK